MSPFVGAIATAYVTFKDRHVSPFVALICQATRVDAKLHVLINR